MNSTKTVRCKGCEVALTSNNYMASGGQGELYLRDNTVFKLYHDRAELPPERKLSELSSLNCDEIVVPVDQVFDTADTYIGFTARYVEGIPLVKLFSNATWRHHSVTSLMILELVKRLAAKTAFVHSKQCVIVDGNEYNYLVDEAGLAQAYFIDVDSYQTPGFPATAIMPSIRDPHATEFSALSDWYSFAVVTFQLWTGIHPFKGKHPTVAGLENRMRENLSVFDPEVRYPPSVRDFNLIPPEFMDWFTLTFDMGERVPPPTQVGAAPIATLQIKVVQQSNAFHLTPIRAYESPILWHWYWNGHDVVRTQDRIYCDSRYTNVSGDPATIFDGNELIIVDEDFGCYNLDGVRMPQTAEHPSSTSRFVMGNRLWSLNSRAGRLTCYGMKLHRLVVEQQWSVLPAATRLFDGFCMSDILGKMHFYLPYTDKKGVKCAIAPVPELDGAKVVDARRRANVVTVITSDAKLVFRFADGLTTYQCSQTPDPQNTQINFAVLNTGVLVGVNDNEDVELAHAAPHSKDVRIVQDDQFNTAATLNSRGDRAGLFAGDTLYSLSLR